MLGTTALEENVISHHFLICCNVFFNAVRSLLWVKNYVWIQIIASLKLIINKKAKCKWKDPIIKFNTATKLARQISTSKEEPSRKQPHSISILKHLSKPICYNILITIQTINKLWSYTSILMIKPTLGPLANCLGLI